VVVPLRVHTYGKGEAQSALRQRARGIEFGSWARCLIAAQLLFDSKRGSRRAHALNRRSPFTAPESTKPNDPSSPAAFARSKASDCSQGLPCGVSSPSERPIQHGKAPGAYSSPDASAKPSCPSKRSATACVAAAQAKDTARFVVSEPTRARWPRTGSLLEPASSTHASSASNQPFAPENARTHVSRSSAANHPVGHSVVAKRNEPPLNVSDATSALVSSQTSPALTTTASEDVGARPRDQCDGVDQNAVAPFQVFVAASAAPRRHRRHAQRGI